MKRAAAALLLLLAAGCSFRSPIIPPTPRAVLDTLVPDLRALAFSPNGLLLASAGGDESPGSEEITLWVVATGERRLTFPKHPGTVTAMAFSPDSSSLAVGEEEGRIRILDASTGAEKVAFNGRRDRVVCLSYSFDGKALISVVEGDPDAEVRRWDVKTGESRDLFTPSAAPPVALAPDGSQLALSSPGDPAGVRIVDLETRKERVLARIGLLKGDALIFTPDCRSVAAVHLEDWSPIPNHVPYLYVLDAAAGKILLRSPRPFGSRRALAVSHDSKLLAHGVGEGFQLWELERREVRTTLDEIPPGRDGVEMLVFSPDDKTLVSSDARGLILLWDVERLLEIRREPAK
jgi:WD40 repeat protein